MCSYVCPTHWSETSRSLVYRRSPGLSYSDNSVTHSHVQFNTINAIIFWNATTLHIVNVSLLQGWARTAHDLCMHSCSVASYEAVWVQPTPVYMDLSRSKPDLTQINYPCKRECILFLCCLSAFVCYVITYVVHSVLVDCLWLALSFVIASTLEVWMWAGFIPRCGRCDLSQWGMQWSLRGWVTQTMRGYACAW